MDKCPYCGAETRPGDNFCLNCGNRLPTPSTAPAPGFSQPIGVGDNTLPAPEDWGASASAQNVHSWNDPSAATVAASSAEPPTIGGEQPTLHGDLPGIQDQQTQAPSQPDHIEHPARFILRGDDGVVLQEYPLDKMEISIGRAPTSDILLSKDKLTSRRHATVRHENGNYVLRDERSANGTFVNGQQIEEMVPRVLQDGDHVGIGEHELLFRAYTTSNANDVADMPTVSAHHDPAAEMTYRTQQDPEQTSIGDDYFQTRTMSDEDAAAVAMNGQPGQQIQPAQAATASDYIASPSLPAQPEVAQSIPVATSYSFEPAVNKASTPAATSASSATPLVPSATSTPAPMKTSTMNDISSSTPDTAYTAPEVHPEGNVTFSNLTNLSQPTLPDITALMAALSALDGQVASLQEQINASQEAIRNHDTEIAHNANQLRTSVRRVAERMDNTIADVARSREALAWAELSQLMEDVMNNPRDIEYVTKLARKARELNKLFQIHQNVLNTVYECNSLLRGLIGESR